MTDLKHTQKVGKGMLYVMWIIVLAALTYFLGLWEKEQYNPNQNIDDTRQGEITLIRNRFNHYVASGMINGQPVVFMLDTGATNVAVPQKVAERLGLEAGYPHKVRTANGTTTVYSTRIDSLSLGSITLSDIRASITPSMEGEEILLGMSALKDLEFTQRGDTLTLRYIP